jgi:chorismate mutase
MRVRAIKGATTVDEDGAREICSSTAELLSEMLRTNGLAASDVVSLVLTSTPDLNARWRTWRCPTTTSRDTSTSRARGA